jgi:hypothetical protein
MASAAAVVILKLVQRLREEFEESPGLRVTIDEGARFWGLDEDVCEVVLSQLVVDGFLTAAPVWRGGRVFLRCDIS